MKRFWRTLLLTGVMSVLCTLTVWAEANFSISNSENAQAGEEFTVQVYVTSDESVNQLEANLVYDSSVLQFVSADEGISEAESGLVTMQAVSEEGITEKSWNMTFRAVNQGNTTLQLENAYAVNNDQGEQQISTSSSQLSVEGTAATEAAPQPEQTQAPGEAVPTQAVQNPPVTSNTAPVSPGTPDQALIDQIANDPALSCLYNNEKWMVSETFDAALIPPYFQNGRQFYKGVEVQSAQLGNSSYHLLYVTREDGSQGQFVHYDQTANTFSPIQKLEITPDRFLCVTQPQGIPEGFSQIMLNVGEAQYTAYQNAPMEQNGFCIIYGVSQSGLEGWFCYDAQENSIQRYVVETGSSVADVETTELQKQLNQANSRYDFLLECVKYVGIALVALLLLLLIINLTVGRDKKGKKNREEDEYEDDYTLAQVSRKEKKKEKKKKREDEYDIQESESVAAGFDDEDTAGQKSDEIRQEDDDEEDDSFGFIDDSDYIEEDKPAAEVPEEAAEEEASKEPEEAAEKETPEEPEETAEENAAGEPEEAPREEVPKKPGEDSAEGESAVDGNTKIYGRKEIDESVKEELEDDDITFIDM